MFSVYIKMADKGDWVSFDEDEKQAENLPPLIKGPDKKTEFLSSEAYISVLGEF